MRPVYGPSQWQRPLSFFNFFKQYVFLSVIKVWHIQSWQVFGERRVVRPYLAERLGRSQVVFRSCLEADVAEIWRVRDNGTEHVAKHGAVDLAVLGFRGTAGPRHVEDVGDVGEFCELGLRVVLVGNVALDVLDRVIGVPFGPGASGRSVDLPRAPGSILSGQNLS